MVLFFLFSPLLAFVSLYERPPCLGDIIVIIITILVVMILPAIPHDDEMRANRNGRRGVAICRASFSTPSIPLPTQK